MEAAGLRPTQLPDRERLEFITGLVSGLQGINSIALGTMWFLATIPETVPWWVDLLLCALVILGIRYLPNYYERRFGAVEKKSFSNLGFAVFLLIILFLMIWGRRIEPVIQAMYSVADHVLHRIVPAPSAVFALLLWIMAFCGSVRRKTRNIDPYALYFCASGVVASFVLALLPARFPGCEHSLPWRTLNAGAPGLTLITLGVYDHITLFRLLPNDREDDE